MITKSNYLKIIDYVSIDNKYVIVKIWCNEYRGGLGLNLIRPGSEFGLRVNSAYK